MRLNLVLLLSNDWSRDNLRGSHRFANRGVGAQKHDAVGIIDLAVGRRLVAQTSERSTTPRGPGCATSASS